MDVNSYRGNGRFNYKMEDIEAGPAAIALVFVLGALFVGALFAFGIVHTQQASTVKTPTPSGGNGYSSATLPLSISVTDPLAKALISTETYATFYTPSGGFVGTCDTSSGTCSTTGQSYTSGTSLIANLVTSGYVTEWIPFTVPYLTAGAGSVTTIPVAFYQLLSAGFKTQIQVGVTTLTITTPGGKTHGGSYQFTSAATQPISISFNYKTADAGYLNCNPGTGLQYDIINKICQSAVFQITDTSTGLSLTGMPRQYSSGSTRYWWAILPDGACIRSTSNGGQGSISQCQSPGAGTEYGISDSNAGGSITEQTIGNNLYGGTSSVHFSLAWGAASSSENLTIGLYFNADPNYFPVNNNLGPNAVNASTPIQLKFTHS